MNKQLTILHKYNALSILQRIRKDNLQCYYLSDDNTYFFDLTKKFGDKLEISNLSGLFNSTWVEIKDSFLECSSTTNISGGFTNNVNMDNNGLPNQCASGCNDQFQCK